MRDREKNNAQDFYTSPLKPELHPIRQRNPSLTFALLQHYTLKIYKKTTQWLLNHTRITPAQQDTSYRPRKPPRTT